VSRHRAKLRYEEVARGDVTDTAADISRAAAAFGYRPAVDLRRGLEAQVRHLERLYGAGASNLQE
jgi:nucleoside-diphosphate-sugar epimerase